MKKAIFFILITCNLAAFAQIPNIVPGPKKAAENVEAIGIEASLDKPAELFHCKFAVNNIDYYLQFTTTGQDDISMQISKKSFEWHGDSGSYTTVDDSPVIVSKEDYDSSNFESFKLFTSRFAEKGSSEYATSMCDDETNWTSSINGMTNKNIEISLKAKARKRTAAGSFLATIGCAISEFGEVCSQSWRFLNNSDDFMNNAFFLQTYNLLQLNRAGRYEETVNGTIQIGEKSYGLSSCSASKVIQHYAP